MNVNKGVAKIQAKRLLNFILKYDKYIILAVFLIVGSLLTRKFLSITNVTNLIKQNVALIVVSIGELLVILSGGIDLSVGSVAVLCGVVLSFSLKAGMSWPLACLIAIILGGLMGLFNGFLITKGGMAPFVATLATMVIYRGVALFLTGGREVLFKNTGFLFLGTGNIGIIPFSGVILVVICIIMSIFLSRTIAGRFIRGIGGNREVVKMAGINTNLYESLTYVISGVLYAIGGILIISRLTIGSSIIGNGWELTAIAAVIIGGGKFVGGIGTIGGTIVGAIILGIIGNLLNLVGVTAYLQQVISGAIIIGAVLLSRQHKD